MSLGLSVVTHTNINFKRDISRCLQSVRDALPAGATHHVIETDGNYNAFLKLRLDAMKLNDIVVFVDDDDYITGDSLKNCVDALTCTDTGIAFTKEVKVARNGFEVSTAPAYVSSMCHLPVVVHHMTAIRTKYISKRSEDLINNTKVTPEWILKVDAALTAGAIHIPTIGYYWVQSDVQLHRMRERRKLFSNNISSIRQEFKSWIHVDYEIKTWDPLGCLQRI